jgi:hypothetical protein
MPALPVGASPFPVTVLGLFAGFTKLRLGMRYFFHLRGPYGSIPDDTGVEASSLEAAEGQARRAVQEIRDEIADADEEWQGWHLEVTDASQCTLLVISLLPEEPLQEMWGLWLGVKNRTTSIHGMLLLIGGVLDWLP